eukprot:s901_g2.t1
MVSTCFNPAKNQASPSACTNSRPLQPRSRDNVILAGRLAVCLAPAARFCHGKLVAALKNAARASRVARVLLPWPTMAYYLQPLLEGRLLWSCSASV